MRHPGVSFHLFLLAGVFAVSGASGCGSSTSAGPGPGPSLPESGPNDDSSVTLDAAPEALLPEMGAAEAGEMAPAQDVVPDIVEEPYLCETDIHPVIPDYPDDGVRVEQTGNPRLDALLKVTPIQCVTKASQTNYRLDSESDDPDSTPVVKTTNICSLNGAYYWVADMDIDCDGRATPGKCEEKCDIWYQPETWTLNKRGESLAAGTTPYVVIPLAFQQANNLKPGSVVAVIFRDRMTFAIFGDTIPASIIGEASYACAERLRIPPSAKDGGVLGHVVTYIAFTGNDVVPGDMEDQKQVDELGEVLMSRFIEQNKPD